MRDYLAEHYERQNRPAPRPIIHWIIAGCVSLVIAWGMGAMLTKTARIAASDALVLKGFTNGGH